MPASAPEVSPDQLLSDQEGHLVPSHQHSFVHQYGQRFQLLLYHSFLCFSEEKKKQKHQVNKKVKVMASFLRCGA